jgi:hypothetical protein
MSTSRPLGVLCVPLRDAGATGFVVLLAAERGLPGMNRLDLPPTLGIVACVALVLTVVTPYVAVSSTDASAVGVFYGTGVLGPNTVALFALVGVVAFAAGRQGRTAPDTIAGATLVLGIVLVVLTVAWALTADVSVAQSTSATWLPYVRWALVAFALVVPASAAWYAVELELF